VPPGYGILTILPSEKKERNAIHPSITIRTGSHQHLIMIPSTINTPEQSAAAMEKLVGNLSNSVRRKTAEDPANLTEEDTTQLTHKLKPELLQASRLRRRMKRDLLLKVEEEQQKVVRFHHHQRSLSANSSRNLFLSSPASMNSIDEYDTLARVEGRDDSY